MGSSAGILPEDRDPLLLLPVPAATLSDPALVQLRTGKEGICVAKPCSHHYAVRGYAWCQLGEPCLSTETPLECDTACGDTDTALLICISFLGQTPPYTTLVLTLTFMFSWILGGLDPVSPYHPQQA